MKTNISTLSILSICLIFILISCKSPKEQGLLNETTQKVKTEAKATASATASSNSKTKKIEKSRVMFYNIENLFDTIDDPKNEGDDEYTPKSEKNWSEERYNKKLSDLAKVIKLANTPDIIGLGEVENRKVIEDLAKKIGNKNWDIVHQDSPDERGIDVGFLYNKDVLKVDKFEAIKINLPKAKNTNGVLDDDFTRDILYISGTINKENVHIFVNHWPSRRSPDIARITTALEVAKRTNKILKNNPKANIIVMGDLNDEPTNKSLESTLNVKNPEDGKITDNDLYALTYPIFKAEKGTYNYKGDINMLDHIIVSGNMLNGKNKIQTQVKDFKILQEDFMIFKHPKYGEMASRTYGSEYYGGISDHFPIYTDLYFK